MRCVIYRRVSTDMQVEEGFSLQAQQNRLSAYAESQGWTIVEDYCDEGYSAKNTDRPQMQRLIEDIQKGKFDVILVYRLDRFVRSVLDLHKLLQLMDKHDIKFKSATEVFDTTSATGRLFITMIATLAQWERETIAERVHMGMTKKVELGERNGAPAPYGYDNKGPLLVKNEDEAKWVKYIFNRYLTVGTQTIAKELNKKNVKTKKGEVWSDFAIRYVLRNPIYTGVVRWNNESLSKGTRKKTGEAILKEFTQEGFEPIIDKSLFDEAQQLLEKRSVQAFRSDNFYPYSGVARCEKCGYTYSGAFKKLKNGRIHRYYKCRGRINFGVCDTQIVAEEAIDNAFLKFLEIAQADMDIEDQANDIDEEAIEKQLATLRKRKERAEELYIDGDINKKRYQSLLEEIVNEESKLLKELDMAEESGSAEEVKELLSKIKNEWYEFSYETRKHAVHLLFKSLTIHIVREAKPPTIKGVVSIMGYEFN